MHSFLSMDQAGPPSSYDSVHRPLSFQRSYNLGALGNWVNNGWSGTGPALQYSHDCASFSESRLSNDLNQIASINGSSLTYDAKGNLLSDGTLTFKYDAFNRLYSVNGPNPIGYPGIGFFYDALGRRTFKGTIATIFYYEYDGQQVVEEYGATHAPYGLLRQYVWGQYVDELIQQREFDRPPNGGSYEDLYPLSDLLYRTVALSRQNPCGSSSSAGPGGSSSGPGNPFAEVYDTDPYGRTRIYNSAGPDGRWFSDDDVRTFDPIRRYIFTGFMH